MKHELAEALSRPKPSTKKPELDHLRVSEAENGGHIVEHHFGHDGGYKEPETHVFGEHDGAKPKVPDGHVLHHIAKMMNIPHEVMQHEEHESAAEMKHEEETGEEA